MNRIKVLKSLVNFEKSLDKIKEDLKKFSWDSDELIFITKRDINKIIEKYKNNEISKEELIKWANIIECREDIGFDESNEKEIQKIIFALANPEISEVKFENISFL